MRADKNESILGYRMPLIRDLLRRISGHVWTDERIARHFHTTLHKASRFADALVERGFIEEARDVPRATRGFVLTDLGHRFCAATFLKPITRTQADALLADLLVRIEAINARDELVFRIAEVHVFGSYFRGAPEVGDVDLAARLTPRRPGLSWRQESLDRARDSGHVSLTYKRMLTFGANEIFKLMRGRTRYLHVTLWEAFQVLDQPSRRIYPPMRDGEAESGTMSGQGGGPASTDPLAGAGVSPRDGHPAPKPVVPFDPVPLRPAA
ncbi:hypothetical protein [Rhodoplanes roseus]|uniref:Polymerase nucleotidyl transferase domain-containing protein n=1 Tax=Rhodoplanes roseus TaxID=29409 RepID=A0A327L723_9BRAD|nr:hypothetical protein [Rhodoplanes roseus]RAI45944.1 hypothetical protein CH341_01125 [Rhodoplanes roseus]